MNTFDKTLAFAGLDGVDLITGNDGLLFVEDNAGSFIFGGTSYAIYNPMANHFQAMAALIKYTVDVDHYTSCTSIASDYPGKAPKAQVCFAVDEDVAKAIIETILISEGLYHE